MACVEVGESAQRGRVLHCTSDVPAGSTLLVELPVFSTPILGTTQAILVASAKFEALDQKVQESILTGFFCPLESRYAQHVKQQVSALDVSAHVLDRMIRIATIIHFNAVQSAFVMADGSGGDPSQEDRLSIFLMACRAAHSCAPNASWHSLDTAGTRVMRSLIPIRCGEEVFVSYLSDEQLLLPKADRRADLEVGKEFHCRCSRCDSDLDDVRVFQCCSPACSGKCVLSGHGVGCCDLCGVGPSRLASSRMLAQEAALTNQLDYFDDVLDTGQRIDISQCVFKLSLGELHYCHWLSLRLAYIKFEFYTQSGDCRGAAKAKEHHALRWHVAPLTRGHAFDLEKVGQAFERAGDFASGARNHFRAFEIHSMLQKPCHPYVTCAGRLCAMALMRLPVNASKDSHFEGKEMLLVGLKAESLNGSVGQCGSFMDGRFAVHLTSGRDILVKAVNLKTMPSNDLQCNDLVGVRGLSSPAESKLNGFVGSLGVFDGDRWAVQVHAHGLQSIKAENLFRLSALFDWLSAAGIVEQ